MKYLNKFLFVLISLFIFTQLVHAAPAADVSTQGRASFVSRSGYTLNLGTQGTQDIIFYTNNTERGRVLSTGAFSGFSFASLKLLNDTYLTARNAAGSADINVLKVDSADDTILNADTGDVIKFAIAGTSQMNLDSAQLNLSINPFSIVGAGNIYYYASGASSHSFRTNSLTRWDITSTGQLLQNASAGGALVLANGATAGSNLIIGAASVNADVTLPGALNVFTGSATVPQAVFQQSTADTAGTDIRFYKSRAVDGSADTIVASGDNVATIRFYASNGTTYDSPAKLQVIVDGTPGASADMPGAFVFSVSPDGSATTAQALKIGQNKYALFGADVGFASGGTISIQEATAGTACSGTLTANGVTDVTVTTSCATTGSRIMLTRTSALAANLAEAYVKSISTGVSFTTNAVASNTSTYNWVIIHEAP